MENNSPAPAETAPVDVRDAGLHFLTALGYGLVVISVAVFGGKGMGTALLGLGLATIVLTTTRYAKKRGERLSSQGATGGARVAGIAYAATAITGLLLALGLFFAHADALLGWALAILLVPSLFAVGVIYEHTLLAQED